MEIRHLITFRTIVEKGGYTKAADTLGYAQSTVTSHIQALEHEMGQPLFNRLGKKMLLTEVGEHLLPYAKQMIELERRATQITALEQQPKGNLIIGASESLTIYRLPSILKQYRERYPHVTIILKTGACSELRHELRNGNIDIAFLIDQERKETDIEVERLVEEPMVFLYANSLSAQNNRAFTTEDTFIYTEKGCSYRTYFEDLLKHDGIVTDDALEFWSVEAIKQCVISGLGVTMLPLMTVTNELINKQLQGRITPPSKQPFVTQLLHHKNKWLSPTLQSFLETVKEIASGWEGDIKSTLTKI